VSLAGGATSAIDVGTSRAFADWSARALAHLDVALGATHSNVVGARGSDRLAAVRGRAWHEAHGSQVRHLAYVRVPHVHVATARKRRGGAQLMRSRSARVCCVCVVCVLRERGSTDHKKAAALWAAVADVGL